MAGFTYVRTCRVHLRALVMDCFSGTIVGWHAMSTKTAQLVTTALRMGLWRRDRTGVRQAPA